MSLLKKLLFSVVLCIVALVAGSYVLPSQWSVERSIVINAAPEKIYPFIANFQTEWPLWSAFDAEYTDSVYTHFGPQEGVGAKRAWTSASMGDGFQIITKADPQYGMEFDLTMINYGTTMHGTILFSSVEDGTLVVWTDKGNAGYNPIMRWMGILMNSMLGNMLEKSLQNLKKIVEA